MSSEQNSIPYKEALLLRIACSLVEPWCIEHGLRKSEYIEHPGCSFTMGYAFTDDPLKVMVTYSGYNDSVTLNMYRFWSGTSYGEMKVDENTIKNIKDTLEEWFENVGPKPMQLPEWLEKKVQGDGNVR